MDLYGSTFLFCLNKRKKGEISVSIFKKLSWFFRQEWKAYFVGVFFLIIVAILQVVSPRIVGIIIDEIALGTLTMASLWKFGVRGYTPSSGSWTCRCPCLTDSRQSYFRCSLIDEHLSRDYSSSSPKPGQSRPLNMRHG